MDTSQRARAIVVWTFFAVLFAYPTFIVSVLIFGEAIPGFILTAVVAGSAIALVQYFVIRGTGRPR